MVDVAFGLTISTARTGHEPIGADVYAEAVTFAGGSGRRPQLVRGTGVVVALEGAAGLVVAVVLVIGGFAGADARVNGYGTAVWFLLVGAASGRRVGVVDAAGGGAAAWRCSRSCCYCGFAWYLGVGIASSGVGMPLAAVALATLALLFSGLGAAMGSRSTIGEDSATPDLTMPGRKPGK